MRDPGCPDLLFHPDLTDYGGCRGWPGMVARPRDANGEPVGGIHRTFLLDDGSGKAPPGKKMLGTMAGGCVRLNPIGPDGDLGIAEGIETALSAQAIFGVPTWAALSADGLRRWQWPAGVGRVTIFADAGEAGVQAAEALADRLRIAGIANQILAPLHGDDFNDDLCRGATVSDYRAPSDETPSPATLRTVAEFDAAELSGRHASSPTTTTACATIGTDASGSTRRTPTLTSRASWISCSPKSPPAGFAKPSC